MLRGYAAPAWILWGTLVSGASAWALVGACACARTRSETPALAAPGTGPRGAAASQAARAVAAVGPATRPAAASRPVILRPGYWMFRLSPDHAGRASRAAPRRAPRATRVHQAGREILSSPALGRDGTIFFGAYDGKVYAVQPDGKLRWSFATKDAIFSSPGIAQDGTVYVGSDDDHLYALDPATGKPRFALRLGACATQQGRGPRASRCDVDAGPTIGPDGTIYVGGDGLYAVTPAGEVRWRFPVTSHVASSPALDAAGNVYFGSQERTLFSLAPDGTERWRYLARGDLDSSPAIGADGTVYIGSDDGRLYAVTRAGQLKWAVVTQGPVRSSPALAADGTIYVGSYDGGLYAVKPDGQVAWIFHATDRIHSSPVVTTDGAVLFGSQDDRLYCIESDGRLRWAVDLGGDVDGTPALAPDGTIFVGADDRALHALK